MTVKYAMTADGKISTKTGASKWITGEAARNEVQKMRHKNMAIMAGIGTVLADDPLLNVRVEGLKSPIRIICDSNLKIPLDSQIVKTADKHKTIIACAYNEECPLQKNNNNQDNYQFTQKRELLIQKGIQIINVPDENGKVDVTKLLGILGNQGIDSIFVEGGGILNDSLFRANLVNRLEVFVAPKVFGGADAKSPVEGIGIEEVSEATEFNLIDIKKIGQDVLLSYERA